MKNPLFFWIAGLAAAVSQTVSALPITDTVVVGTQEWAQVDLFSGNSWNTISMQCPDGTCTDTSTLSGYELAGWTWASVDTVQTLFDVFTGQSNPAPSSYIVRDSSWAPAFLSLFGPTGGRCNGVSSCYILAWTSTPDPLAPVESAYIGYVQDTHRTNTRDYASTYTEDGTHRPYDNVGAWLVRPANTVPVPTTLTLFGLGLAGLSVTRHKRGAKV
jgi:hypothetical protein